MAGKSPHIEVKGWCGMPGRGFGENHLESNAYSIGKAAKEATSEPIDLSKLTDGGLSLSVVGGRRRATPRSPVGFHCVVEGRVRGSAAV